MLDAGRDSSVLAACIEPLHAHHTPPMLRRFLGVLSIYMLLLHGLVTYLYWLVANR